MKPLTKNENNKKKNKIGLKKPEKHKNLHQKKYTARRTYKNFRDVLYQRGNRVHSEYLVRLMRMFDRRRVNESGSNRQVQL